MAYRTMAARSLNPMNRASPEELIIWFDEGGVACQLRAGMDANQVAYELHRMADALERISTEEWGGR